MIPSLAVARSTQESVVGSGQSGGFTLDTPMMGGKDVWVHYALSGSAVNGQDYRLRTGLVLFKARANSKTIKIIPQGDLGGASKRTVKFTLLADKNTSKIRLVAGQ